MARRVSAEFAGVPRGKTDDMREDLDSAGHGTAGYGARVRAYDPAGMEQVRQVLSDVAYCRGAYECVEGPMPW